MLQKILSGEFGYRILQLFQGKDLVEIIKI